jgi:hypothetical protein
MHFSVSPLEKKDAQIQLTRGRVVPTADCQKSLVGGAISDSKKTLSWSIDVQITEGIIQQIVGNSNSTLFRRILKS